MGKKDKEKDKIKVKNKNIEIEVIKEVDELKDQLELLIQKLENTKVEIHDKIHDEDVKSYRNTKSLIDKLHGKLGEEVNITQDSVNKIKNSMGIMKGILAFGIINCCLLIFLITGLLSVYSWRVYSTALKNNAEEFVSAEMSQMQLNIDNYFDRIEGTAALLFSDENFYIYDKTSVRHIFAFSSSCGICPIF